MKTTTTIRSPGALALGVFFTGVTGFTIFNDVWNGATFTIAHLNAATRSDRICRRRRNVSGEMP